MCALTSSRLDDFSDIVTYAYCNDKILFGGGVEVRYFGGGDFYPSNTLDRTLQGDV